MNLQGLAMATEQSEMSQDLVQPYAETDNSVENRKAVSDRIISIHSVTSNRFWQFATLSAIMFGLGIIGLVMRLSSGFDDKQIWGYYVAIFAFLMTTSSAAPMVAMQPCHSQSLDATGSGYPTLQNLRDSIGVGTWRDRVTNVCIENQ